MKTKIYMFIVCLVIAVMGGIIAEGAEIVANGSTDVSLYVVIEDANGDPNVSAVPDDLDLYYVEYQTAISSKIDLTSSGASATGHTDNTAIHIGNGLFKIDPPNIAFDGGIGTQVTFIIDDGATSNRTAFLTVLLTPPVDAAAVSGDTTTADNLQAMTANMLIVYSTDWATNYDTDENRWSVDVNTVRGAVPISTDDINAEVDEALNTAIPGSPTADSINERILAIDDKLPSSGYLKGTAESDGGMDTADKDDINAQVDTALSDIYLDYAFAVDYNPASKPGVATALLNELVEDNGSGVSRFTQTALSQAPSITEASWDSTTVSSATDAGTFVIADGVVSDDVYNGFLITVTDADGDNEPEPAFVKDYISATKTVILSTKLSFTPASGDAVRFLAGFGGDFGITLFRK